MEEPIERDDTAFDDAENRREDLYQDTKAEFKLTDALREEAKEIEKGLEKRWKEEGYNETFVAPNQNFRPTLSELILFFEACTNVKKPDGK